MSFNFIKGSIKIRKNINYTEKMEGLSESEINSVIPLLSNEKTVRDLVNFFSNVKYPNKFPYGSFLP
jgi:hypothetical protein